MNRHRLLLFILLLPAGAPAEILRLDIRTREPHPSSAPIPYEVLTGIAHHSVDPTHPSLRSITDLHLAPRDADGRVVFSADFRLLKPVDPARGNGALLYDVNNRGNPLALGFFHTGSDGFLLRHGFTVLWSGWIGELLPAPGKLLLAAPIARDGDRDITGRVRFEMVCDAPADTLPLSRREGHGSVPPTERGEAEGILTWRLRQGDRRIPIPRAQWSLLRLPIPPSAGVPGTLAPIRLRLSGGFQPGYIYELIYEARGPVVQGLGFAAVRDLVSYLRYDLDDGNPLRIVTGASTRPAITRAIGFGVSQSGRFLRELLRLGFHLDEKGRKVFDALMPHVAGGGLGFFHQRFAQPTRHNGQHEEHLYPADRFPFSYGPSTDPFTGRAGAVMPIDLPAETLPFVMHTQSAAEYWHRSGSLVHTDPSGKTDATVPERVRIYAFGGTQHGPAGRPPSRGIARNLANPGDYRPFLRALLLALDAWVRDGTPPPPSDYPRIDDGTLIDPARYVDEFPGIPGVRPPEVIQRPPHADLGPDFEEKGIISVEPPRVLGEYTVLVPRPDALGNDRGMLLPPEVAVPLATFTGWNLRAREVGAEDQLASLLGSWIPLSRTRAERDASGDPRRSIEELHGSFEDYRHRLEEACRALERRRLLLPEDAQRILAEAEGHRDLFPPRKP